MDQSINTPTPASPSSPELRDLVRDGELLAGVRHDGVHRAVNAVVGERTSLLRDALQIAIPILGGAITLYVLAPHLVKTPVLFFISVASVIFSVIGGMIIRIQLLSYLQMVVLNVETQFTNVAQAARNLKGTPTQENITAMVTAETTPAVLPPLKWTTEKGYLWVVGLLLFGILGIAAALLFDISV